MAGLRVQLTRNWIDRKPYQFLLVLPCRSFCSKNEIYSGSSRRAIAAKRDKTGINWESSTGELTPCLVT